jgi:hypothetical protein
MKTLSLLLCGIAVASPLQLPLQAKPKAFHARLTNAQSALFAHLDLDVLSHSHNHTDVLLRDLDELPSELQLEFLREINLPTALDNFPASLDIHASYHTLESFESLMRAWTADYPQYAQLLDIGKSAEGRSIPALLLSKSNQKTPSPYKKMRFLVTGGQHAREWISSSVVLYFMDQLLFAATLPENVVVGEYARALENFEFVFAPILNPDGYQYTWTDDRRACRGRLKTKSDF